MVKKLVFILVVLVLVAIPLLAACETTTEVIELTINDHNPAGGPVDAIDYWAAYVEEQSGGRLDLNVIHGGALLADNEAFRGTQTGVCDAAYYVMDRGDGFLLSTVMALPFMPWPEQHVEDAYWTLLDEFPEMSGEWEDVTIITFIIMPGTHIHTTGKVVETPEDLAGLKMMGAEAMTVEALNAMGATGVDFDIMDMTPSLQTNLLQGVLNHFPVLTVFSSLELLPCHTVFGDGGINHTPMSIIFNTEVLEDLPRDMRNLILDSGDVWLARMIDNDNADQAGALAFAEENNHTMTYLTPEEIKVYYDLVKGPVHDAWITEAEAAGLPGQEVYDRAYELAEGWTK